jgi:hypothetical protein
MLTKMNAQQGPSGVETMSSTTGVRKPNFIKGASSIKVSPMPYLQAAGSKQSGLLVPGAMSGFFTSRSNCSVPPVDQQQSQEWQLGISPSKLITPDNNKGKSNEALSRSKSKIKFTAKKILKGSGIFSNGRPQM